MPGKCSIKKGLYEHYKGKRYEVIDVATHTETLEPMVVYKALYKGDFPEGALWVRPLAMFKEKITVEGKLVSRFRFLSKAPQLYTLLITVCFLTIGQLPLGYGQTEDVSKYLSDMKDSNADLRMSAIEALGSIKDPRGVQPLIAALKDTNNHIRAYAARSLGFIEDPSAVDALIVVLKDQDIIVRRNAARALGLIKDPRAVEPLIVLLKDTDSKVRLNAVTALGKIKDIRAYEPLSAAKKDPDKDVQNAAAEALGGKANSGR